MARVTKIFGARLREAREGLNLTQTQLGQQTGGISDETIGRIERSEVGGLLTKHVPGMAAALKMSVEDFRKRLVAPLVQRDTDTMQVQLPRGLVRRLRAMSDHYGKTLAGVLEEYAAAWEKAGKIIRPAEPSAPAATAAARRPPPAPAPAPSTRKRRAAKRR